MQGSFQVVLGSVVTLFLMMAVGFFFTRGGMLTPEALSQLSGLLLYVVTPCIMVDLFLVERTAESDRQILSTLWGLLAVYAVCILLDVFLFRGEPEGDRGVMRFAVMYGNKGFMGIPLIRSALGGEAAMVAAFALAVFNVFTWTHGYAVIGGRGLSAKKVLANPVLLGFALAMALYLTGWRLPGPVSEAVGYLGSLNTPLAMVVIGGQMAGADLAAVFRDRRLYEVSALKLVAVPALAMLVLLPFHMDATAYLALVILFGCPCAGVTALFSQMMGKNTSLAAGLVTLSTLLSILTLPLVALGAQFFL